MVNENLCTIQGCYHATVEHAFTNGDDLRRHMRGYLNRGRRTLISEQRAICEYKEKRQHVSCKWICSKTEMKKIWMIRVAYFGLVYFGISLPYALFRPNFYAPANKLSSSTLYRTWKGKDSIPRILKNEPCCSACMVIGIGERHNEANLRQD